MRRNGFVVLAVLSIFLLIGGAAAQTQPAAAQPQPAASQPEDKAAKWGVEDVIMAESAGGFDISPDGKWAVWVKGVADKEKDGRVSNLILSSLTEKSELELTRGTDNSFNPRWSPDGKRIAFVSARPVPRAKPGEAARAGDGPKPQLWLINPFGGEPWNVTTQERGVTNFEWADDDTIIFSSPEDPTYYESATKEKKDASVVVEDEVHTPPVRLFKLSLKAKAVTRLTDNEDRITSFALSPDGTKAVTEHSRSLRYVYDNRVKPVVFLYDLKTGERKPIFAEPKFNIGQVRWARDGQGFYATSAFTNHPQYVNATIQLMYYYAAESGAVTQVPLGWENGLAGGWQVTGDGFIALLANGARHKPARYTRSGGTWSRTLLEGEHATNIFGVALGKDGKTLLYEYSTASTPNQWYRATLDGAQLTAPAQVTDINQHFKKKTISRSEVVRWKGALDEGVEGILYYPHNYEAGKKYPLVLMIHGGPAGADFDSWKETWGYPTNLMTQRGAFVLKPNYHGSSNYGLKWVESIGNGKYYDLEVPDIEKGVDYLIARGLVDPQRLGTMGWSNGSILSIALTVNSDRYKVAGAGAGDVEWISDWGNAHFGAAFDNYYFGKSPLEDPALYIKKSPFFRLNKVKTPTIIFFGTLDTNVPTQQGWLHYRALQQAGNTDVRFILFPGEPHSLQKLSHQRRKLEEELAWFDKYLFDTYKPENEAFKAGSPLDVALKMKLTKRDGLRYGLVEKGALVPETVKHGKVELGRFEVTRAQYAAFDKTYKVEPGQENYPANNISLEQARAYCDWLSKLTGQTYRLGTEEELASIYDSARDNENTLDFWAGYKINPDDAARLALKVKELGGAAPLLKEVGSFKGVGDEPVFDLGGNVAEWVIAKDGSGKKAGGSADRPADAKSGARRAGPEYTGFRVVKGTTAAGR